MQIERQAFYPPQAIFSEVEQKLQQLMKNGQGVDYLTFVPDGEPTLDLNLGTEIAMLKLLRQKIAVITNASLLWREDVRKDLAEADWVSVKIDAVDSNIWRAVDRPHGALDLSTILAGVVDFARQYKGQLVTETMLVDGLNDSTEALGKLAELLALIRPEIAYLLVPTRPPAERNVRRPPNARLLEAARAIRRAAGVTVEWITGDEREDGFFCTGDIVEDLLSITAVHPLRAEIVNEMIKSQVNGENRVDELVKQGLLLEFWYEGKKFYRKQL
jgi:wyosine [tRNA(Phe)-imidazoG37] synthetase (radical SAM superfamily)